ncbi:MAG TPA: C-GCAxxG-C-C family protein [Sulfurimonas sp.]|uniref:C-GCAxxG-C-C family protein n=1 Tax=Sulfurimonas sp. TaxID=2022749 RepID=UPI002CA6034B|nr:C-GCAxxG-C-C family protein [Sulfurimonas sp.]HUH42885.1 C-GCAxxG-C-C family protein [Sulfurimonas sp.]
MNMSRREALSGLGCLAVVATSELLAAPESLAPKKAPALPWAYAILDPQHVAKRAYENYFSHHCMYASFEAIIGELADKFGEPYSSFPFDMMAYGSGGVAGWGSLCGTLNGAAAAIQLVSHRPEEIIAELFRWYETTPIPNVNLTILTDETSKYPQPIKVKPSISHSVLCHVTISKWVKESGKSLDSVEKSQRCAQAAASVAKKSVELLNAEKNGTLVFTHQTSSEIESCIKCHSGATSRMKDTQGKMDCLSCHAGHGK